MDALRLERGKSGNTVKCKDSVSNNEIVTTKTCRGKVSVGAQALSPALLAAMSTSLPSCTTSNWPVRKAPDDADRIMTKRETVPPEPTAIPEVRLDSSGACYRAAVCTRPFPGNLRLLKPTAIKAGCGRDAPPER